MGFPHTTRSTNFVVIELHSHLPTLSGSRLRVTLCPLLLRAVGALSCHQTPLRFQRRGPCAHHRNRGQYNSSSPPLLSSSSSLWYRYSVGHPLARTYSMVSAHPLFWANSIVYPSHSQPCSRAHRNTSRCPPSVYRRKLKLKRKLESGSSHFTSKRLVTGAFSVSLIGSTCTALPQRR
jgi:hypothetical protein